jgi:hypothetical protein
LVYQGWRGGIWGRLIALADDGPLWTRWASGVLATILAGYLLAVAAPVSWATLRRRRRHRELLGLVGQPLPELPGGRLLDSATAMAYGLPGLRPRMVVTSAALTNLSAPALALVAVGLAGSADDRAAPSVEARLARL